MEIDVRRITSLDALLYFVEARNLLREPFFVSERLGVLAKYSCRIVAKCKSAKQRCRKLAHGQKTGSADISSWATRESFFACLWVHGAAKRSIARCADLALVKGVRQINANGCPTARDGQCGEC